MKSVNKIILAGLAALWTACSNDASVDSDLSGATTEPNSSKTAELTEEQKAILNKSFYSLVDKQKAKVVLNNDSDSLIEVILDQPTLLIGSETIEILKLMFPFSTKVIPVFIIGVVIIVGPAILTLSLRNRVL